MLGYTPPAPLLEVSLFSTKIAAAVFFEGLPLLIIDIDAFFPSAIMRLIQLISRYLIIKISALVIDIEI